MIKLRLRKDYYNFVYQNDIDRIVKIFAERGYEISHTDACRAWEKNSDSMCAGWLILGENDDYIFRDCFRYFEELD